MAYYLIAQTESKQHLGDAYQLFVYQNLTSAPGSVVTLELLSDYVLKRGSASAKNKLEYIKYTSIDFEINDVGRFMISAMKDKPDTDFKGILKKNGSDFFIGYLSLYLSKFDFTKTDTQIRLTLFDGLKKLKDYDGIEAIGNGLLRVKDILRATFNKLDFGINIHHYTKFYLGDYNGIKPFYTVLQKIEDIVSTSSGKLSYYDLLLIICQQYQLTVYQENAIWVLRQNTSLEHTTTSYVDGVLKETIIYDSIAETSVTRVDQDVVILREDLMENPRKFYFDRIGKASINVGCYTPQSAPKIISDLYYLEWKNPFFKEGQIGWTIESGTANFKNDSCYVDYGSSISQTSGSFLAGEKFNVKLSATSIRMVLATADRITDQRYNPLVRIVYIGTSNTYYRSIYGTWDIAPPLDGSLFGLVMYGITIGSNWIEEYNKNTLQLNLELTAPAEDGVVKIILYGGAVASGNNYEYEFMAQHHYCIVQKKITDLATIISPNKLNVFAEIIGGGSEVNINVPYLEFQPYSGVSIWYSVYDPYDGETISRARKWTLPNGEDRLSLLLVKRLLAYNRRNSGYDLDIVPGKLVGFTNVFAMNMESTGTNYFIAVYEETALISDHKRFIVMQNEGSVEAISASTEFVFDDVT